MRFKATRKPHIGETRVRFKFAWWPVLVGDVRVWMESYVSEQKYIHDRYEDHWIEISTSLINRSASEDL